MRYKSVSIFIVVVTCLLMRLLSHHVDIATAGTVTKPSAVNIGGEVVRFMGRVSFKWRNRDSGRDVQYKYYYDRDTGIGRLAFSLDNSKNDLSPTFQTEPGQQFLRAIYPVRFGQLGDLLFTEWEYGMSALRVTIYRLNESDNIEPVFDKICRFGCRALDVGDNDIPNMCAADGAHGGPIAMEVYGWDGKTFVLLRTVEVARPHAYAIESRVPAPKTVRVIK